MTLAFKKKGASAGAEIAVGELKETSIVPETIINAKMEFESKVVCVMVTI